MIYKLNVKDRIITHPHGDDLIQNGIESDYVQVAFDAEWKSLTSFRVVFVNGGASIGLIFSMQNTVTIQVPWEVLQNPGRLFVTFIGYSGDTKRIVTQIMERPFRVISSGKIVGDDERTPTIDEICSLMNAVDMITRETEAAAAKALKSASSANEAASRADESSKSAIASSEHASTAAEAAEAVSRSESERVNAEADRVDAESARAAAESGRVSAEEDRAENQAKNNADQAINNAAIRKLEPYICADGEYDPTTLMPTIKGEANRLYLTPSGQGPVNRYVEWMIIAGSWEIMGVSDIDLKSVTTDEIDAVVDEHAPAGESVLSLTGLSYLWAKVKACFAPKSHASSGYEYGIASTHVYGHARASTTLPKPAGIAVIGSESDAYARGNHVHPIGIIPTENLSGMLLTGGSISARNVLEIGKTPDGISQIAIKTKIPYASNNMCAVRIHGSANYLVADLTVTWYNYVDGGNIYSPRVAYAGDALPLAAYVSTYDDAGTERIAITLVGDSPGVLRFGGLAVDCFAYNTAAPRAYFEGWACSMSTATSPSIAPPGRLAKCSVASSVGANQITPGMLNKTYRALTGKPSVLGGEDLNSYRSVGSYKCETNAWAATIKNCPTGSRAFEMIVNPVLDNSTYLRQEVKPYDSCKRYERVSVDGGKTWQGWVQTSVAEAPQYIDMGSNGYAVKKAGWVRLRLFPSLSAKPWSDNLIYTLPIDFRPKRYWEAVGAHNAGNVLIVVSPNGQVKVNPFEATLSSSKIYGGITYPLETN